MIDKNFIQKYSTIYDKNNLEDIRVEREIRNSLDSKTKFLSKNLLQIIALWKTGMPINKRRANSNNEQLVKEVTLQSFSSNNEEFKIKVLTILEGIWFRTATAILHFRFPDNYTIMDRRAWGSLQNGHLTKDEPDGYKIDRDYKIKDDFEHWQKYLEVCKNISNRENCSLRELDKALWQYNKKGH